MIYTLPDPDDTPIASERDERRIKLEHARDEAWRAYVEALRRYERAHPTERKDHDGKP